jgi:catechol 2,3-dioxygenase-like lactoylglutathione lyase family enzyme
MIRGIDHLVIACPDPDAAAALLESELGLAVTGGGRHPGAGSWNRIAWLADGSYLELIGVDDPGLASKSPVNAAAMRALETGGGLATYALLVDGIDLTAQSLQGAGATFGSPSPIDRSAPPASRFSFSTPTSAPNGARKPWPSALDSAIRSDPRSGCMASTSRRRTRIRWRRPCTGSFSSTSGRSGTLP